MPKSMEEILADIEELDAGGLRDALRSAHKLNQDLTSENRTLKASALLAEVNDAGARRFQYVKPEDLDGIDPAKLEEIATRIQTEREAFLKEGLADVAKAQGIDPEKLAEQLQSRSPEAEAHQRAAAAAAVSGSNPAKPTDPDEAVATGPELIRSALSD